MQIGGRFVQRGHFTDKGEGVFRCGRPHSTSPHVLMQKTSDFSKFMICSHEQSGGSQMFAILRGRPFWTAP